VHAQDEAIAAEAAQVATDDFDAAFLAHYSRVARVVGRVVRDRGRAEEIAVDVFLKWGRHQEAHGEHATGWLYRTAVRMGLDELRRQARRTRFERLFGAVRAVPPTPEDLHAARDEQQRVRTVLAGMRRRDASLLLLRGDGQSYEEIAAALGMKSTSVGTLLNRAQRAFRTEYERRYGTH
jgi:RNA polymerase sigma-70 factor (ECF subfamily)